MDYNPPVKKILISEEQINKRVKDELGFTVNIGIAHNKLLAVVIA